MNGGVGTITERTIGMFQPSRPRLDQLGVWFAAEYEPLLRFAYFLSGDLPAAEDLVQDAFVRLYRAERRIEEDGFRAYARRTIANLHRSRFRRIRSERRALAESRRETPILAPEPADHVWRAILALPSGQRAVVALRYYEDLSEQETATALGVSPGTVKKQLHRAMTKLRDALGDRSEP